jgi:hypothetical protein
MYYIETEERIYNKNISGGAISDASAPVSLKLLHYWSEDLHSKILTSDAKDFLLNVPENIEFTETIKVAQLIDLTLGVTTTFSFIRSIVLPSKKDWTPLVLELYESGGRSFVVLFFSECYAPNLLYLLDSSTWLTNLSDLSAISLFLGSLKDIEHDINCKLNMNLTPPPPNAIRPVICALNINKSPGHYFSDELPFIVGALEAVSSYSAEYFKSLKICHVQGLGFQWLDSLINLRFSTRASLYEYINSHPCRLILPYRKRLFTKKEGLRLSDHVKRFAAQKTGNTSDRSILKICFGIRWEPRDGFVFMPNPERVVQLIVTLRKRFLRLLGWPSIDVRLIIDGRLFDGDLPKQPTAPYTERFISECIRYADFDVIDIGNLEINDKLFIYENVAFGIYPWGSNNTPYVELSNAKTYVHCPNDRFPIYPLDIWNDVGKPDQELLSQKFNLFGAGNYDLDYDALADYIWASLRHPI